MGGGPPYGFFYSDAKDGDTAPEENGDDTLAAFNGWYSSLNFDEQLCFVFDCRMSHLDTVYWSNTMQDIKTQIKLKLGFVTVRMTQEYLSFLKVAGKVLGGSEDKPKATKDEAEAVAVLDRIFG